MFVDGIIANKKKPVLSVDEPKPIVREYEAVLHVAYVPVQKSRGVLRPAFAGFLALSLAVVNTVIPLAAFEAHVVNVTAKIEPRDTCTAVGFETGRFDVPLAAGQFVGTAFAHLGFEIFGLNAHPDHSDGIIIFDSSSPTGGDDDLGTPHEDFGGPGIGAGGASGEPGENSMEQSNVLIIPENKTDANDDGLVDDPDDEAAGGKIIFSFDDPTTVNSLRILDIEEEGAKIEFYGAGAAFLGEVAVSALGDNSAQTLEFNKTDVKEMHVVMPGSGAVDDLCFEPPVHEYLCDARSIGYWRNHEGCSGGSGSSVWTAQIRSMSVSLFSGVFGSYTGSDICSAVRISNCPSGKTIAGRLCRAKAHTLADELNVVSGRLDLDALIAGADDGDHAFDKLGLDKNSTVREALAAVEKVIADGASSSADLRDAAYVARQIYDFYEFGCKGCVYNDEDFAAKVLTLDGAIKKGEPEDGEEDEFDDGGEGTDGENPADVSDQETQDGEESDEDVGNPERRGADQREPRGERDLRGGREDRGEEREPSISPLASSSPAAIPASEATSSPSTAPEAGESSLPTAASSSTPSLTSTPSSAPDAAESPDVSLQPSPSLSPDPTPQQTPTHSPTPEATPSPDPSPTSAPGQGPSPDPTPTPDPSPEPSPDPAPLPEPEPSTEPDPPPEPEEG